MKLRASTLPIIDARALGADCDSCPLWNAEKPLSPVPPKTCRNAEAIVLAESPGETEVEKRTPLIGASGRLMDALLDKAGGSRAKLHLTNTILCRPDRKLSPAEWKQARSSCRPRLIRELETTKAKTVLAFGNHAAAETIGKSKIFDWMGAPSDGIDHFEGYKVLPSFHFAHALRYPEWTPVLLMFMQRGLALARGKLPEWDWGKIVTEADGDKAVQAALRKILAAEKKFLNSDYGLGIDVETAGIDPLNHALLNVGIASPDLMLSVSVSWQECSATTAELVRKLLASRWRKTCHNGQFDILSLESNGLKLANYDFDTLHADAVVRPRLRHKLDIVSSVEFPAPKWKAEFRKTDDKAGSNRFVQADPVLRAIYNAQDCFMTALLRKRLWFRLSQVFNGKAQFAEYMELNEIAYESRRYGFRVQQSNFAKHRKSLSRKRRDAKRVIRAIAEEAGCAVVTTVKTKKTKRKGVEQISTDTPFNAGSSAHIRHLFIDKLGVQPKSYSQKTGLPSFKEKDLSDLAAYPSAIVRKAARAVIMYRRWTKYLKTYIEGMPVGPDGRVHATPNPSGARTGRWTYQDPSLQVIPKPAYRQLKNGKKQLEAPGLRDLFCATEGYTLLEADYKALEAWVLAFLSGDVKLLEMLRSSDIHNATAAIIFGPRWISADPETESGLAQRKKMRELAKRARYAMHYGAQPVTAWAALVVDFPELSLSDVQRLFNAFEKLHPQLVAWQRRQLASAYECDHVEAPLSGRRYYFHRIVEPTKCYNLPIQMSGADIMNRAILRIWRRFKAINKAEGKVVHMILVQVHDAVVAESLRPLEAARIIREEMERAVAMNGIEVVFPIDLSQGENWGNMEHLELQAA